MCRLNSCCCGCSVKDGTVVLAILNVLGGVIQLCVALYEYPWLKDESPSYNERKTEGQVDILIATVAICIGAILLHGIRKENKIAVLVWLVLGGIQNVLFCIFTVAFCFSGDYDNFDVGIALLLIALLSIYFWLIAFSYWRQLSEGRVENPV